MSTAEATIPTESKKRPAWERLLALGVLILVIGAAANLLGWDIKGWFDELWDTFLLGVGPAGEYVVSLPADSQETLREEYRRRLGEPTGALTLSARAWAARGRVPA